MQCRWVLISIKINIKYVHRSTYIKFILFIFCFTSKRIMITNRLVCYIGLFSIVILIMFLISQYKKLRHQSTAQYHKQIHMVGAQFLFFAIRHKIKESWISGLKQKHFVSCLGVNMLEVSDGDGRVLTTLQALWIANTFSHVLFHCPLCIWSKVSSWLLLSFNPSHLRLGFQAIAWPVPCRTLPTETSVHSMSSCTKLERDSCYLS